MEHPLDNGIIQAVDIKKLDDAGSKMIELAHNALKFASEYPWHSTTRYLHTRDALEYIIQAHAYGKNVASDLTNIRSMLDECVNGQIEEAKRGD